MIEAVQFVYRLQELAHMMQWYGPTVETTFDAPYVCTVKMACPHGEIMEQQVSVQVMDVPKPSGLADLVMQQFHKRCEMIHAKTPPPGQFVYSLASPEHAYADIQSYVLTSLLKSYGELLDKYSTYGGVSVGGISYGSVGGSTGSILGQLLKICPGLANVERPCPKCKQTPMPLSYAIQHVNDGHQWSREKIAEWLDIIALEDPNVDLTITPITDKEKKA
jgi:hypothetical protein